MAAAVIPVVTGILGAIGGSKGKKAARRAAREAAVGEAAVTAERVEQLYAEERTLAGQTLAIGAGSGTVLGTGSVLNVLAEQALQFNRERQIVNRVGASRAAAALAQGKAVGQQYQAQGLQSLFQGIGQGVTAGYNVGLFSKVPKV